jgi:hypothetical protein
MAAEATMATMLVAELIAVIAARLTWQQQQHEHPQP